MGRSAAVAGRYVPSNSCVDRSAGLEEHPAPRRPACGYAARSKTVSRVSLGQFPSAAGFYSLKTQSWLIAQFGVPDVKPTDASEVRSVRCSDSRPRRDRGGDNDASVGATSIPADASWAHSRASARAASRSNEKGGKAAKRRLRDLPASVRTGSADRTVSACLEGCRVARQVVTGKRYLLTVNHPVRTMTSDSVSF
jgi:hypothetical protein